MFSDRGQNKPQGLDEVLPNPEPVEVEEYRRSYSAGFIAGHALAYALSFEDMMRQNAELYDAVDTHEEIYERLQAKVNVDALTGLSNRHRMEEDIEARIALDKPFGVVFLDLDKFKAVNDNLGHLAGDELLVGVGKHVKSMLKRSDDLYRFGGDEFVVIFGLEPRDRRADKALQPTILERLDTELEFLRQGLAEYVDSIPEDKKVPGFNISAGGTYYDPRRPSSSSDLIGRADAEMYLAKLAKRTD